MICRRVGLDNALKIANASIDHTSPSADQNASTFIDTTREVKPAKGGWGRASHPRARSELCHLHFDDLRKQMPRLSICDDLFIVIANNELSELSRSPENIRG
ncbi:hypothetical protein GCM10020255_104490 [Rhodococcus baikonurensis]